MSQIDDKPTIAHLPARLALALAALLCFGLLAVSSARAAAFEQVGCFSGSFPGPVNSCKPVAEEKFGEEVQLGGVGGMAVNYTGAGGVPKGTVYAARSAAGGLQIAMYEPLADGGLKFVEAWEVTSFEEAYERCGPPGELPTGETVHPSCPPRANNTDGSVDVDVDQSTGNVYAINGTIPDPGFTIIAAYTPTGSEVIARFGETVAEGKTTAETPDKIHSSNLPGGIAVNDAGEVYVYDNNAFAGYYRLMKFQPKTPGNYTEYEYAGTASDVGGRFFSEGKQPAQPVMDAAGRIYTTAEAKTIEAYDPAHPADPPICSFESVKGGITAITVNPLSGEVFFFSYRKEEGFKTKLIHQLGPCNPASGKFEGPKGEAEVGRFEVSPERDDLWGLAFDPVRKFSPTRAAGVLYGGAAGPGPSGTGGKGEPGQSSLGYIFAGVEENPPQVGSESVSKVTATSAQLSASVDPKGFKTNYVFQYLTEAAFKEAGESFAGAAEAPLGGAPLPGSGEAQSVAVTLSGLSPLTHYVYRVLASSHCSPSEESKVCETAGVTQEFRTFPIESPGLPDGRVWELVSPPNKNGGEVYPADPRVTSCGSNFLCKPGFAHAHLPTQSTPNGDAMVYEGSAFSSGQGTVDQNQYIARRDGKTGWQTVGLTPSLLNEGTGGGYAAFDTALNRGVLGQKGPALSPEAPAEYQNLYAQSTANPLALGPLLTAEPPNRPPVSVEGSGVFQVNYAGASADLSRIFFEANDALTEEAAFAPEAVDGGAKENNLYEWAEGQLRLVNVMPGNSITAPWPRLSPGGGSPDGGARAVSVDGSKVLWSDSTGQLYLREGAETTREIPDPGKFLAASSDDSKVLLGNGHLYDLEAETTTDLSEGKGGFEGILGQSDDLSHLYFIDTALLTGEEENSEGDKAQAGKFNLYSWGEGTTTRFVARLVAGDNSGTVLGSDWSTLPTNRTAKASHNGRFVAFLSYLPLTGYDNVGPCELNGETGEFLPAPCPEAFLYDSATGKLSCASCNPSGTRPLGWSVLRLIKGSSSPPQADYLTDSGRLYFDSRDSLVLGDTNEGVEDVYQYEQQGIGECELEGGCVSLISAGSEAVDSNFMAADPSGKDVFFTTRDQLALKDHDDLLDLYDAREGGGIPGETETARNECQGEACVAALAPPNDPTPGSSSFEGAGNVDEKKATKKHHKKKKQAKKHKKSKHAHKRANNDRGGAK